MRQILTLLFAFALLATCANHTAAADHPAETICTTAKTQIEMDYCADRDFKAADKKLNALYRQLIQNYDRKNQALLKTAERDWISYRDSECALETAASMGGSIYPMEYSLCLTEKTGARIKELERQRN